MPESTSSICLLRGEPLTAGKTWDLGLLNVSPEEIIAYAKVVDPLPFHTDPEAAAKSHFGTLVASGPMMYSLFHQRRFLPLFGPSILAGRGIDKWRFVQPHYPNRDYRGKLTAQEVQHRPEKGTARINWHFQFFDAEDRLAQELQVSILHQCDRP